MRRATSHIYYVFLVLVSIVIIIMLGGVGYRSTINASDIHDDEENVGVTCVIPTHNRWAALNRAVQSVQAQTGRAKIPLVILIVNDASTEVAYEQVHRWPHEVVRRTHEYEVWAFLSTHDVVPPEESGQFRMCCISTQCGIARGPDALCGVSG